MRRVAGAAVLVVAVGLLSVAPASAGTPGPTVSLGSAGGFEYLKATFEDVVSQTGAPADCDAGDGITGGGGSISGSGANAGLNATAPTDAGGTAWQAEGSTTGAPRTVTTYAICGNAELGWSFGGTPMGAAGNPNDHITLSDGCGEDELALGGVEGTDGNVRIIATRPDGAHAWTSAVQNYGGVAATGGEWYLCTIAYPATIRKESDSVKSGKAGKVTAKCRGGEAVIDGGFASTQEDAPALSTWATSTRPYDSKDNGKVPEDGWQVKLQNDNQGKSKLTVYALCG